MTRQDTSPDRTVAVKAENAGVENAGAITHGNPPEGIP